MAARPTRRRAALTLMAHAVISTKDRTYEETAACNQRLTRARDWLLHSEATAVVRPGLVVSPAEMHEMREEALEEVRLICAGCGACRLFGIKLP